MRTFLRCQVVGDDMKDPTGAAKAGTSEAPVRQPSATLGACRLGVIALVVIVVAGGWTSLEGRPWPVA